MDELIEEHKLRMEIFKLPFGKRMPCHVYLHQSAAVQVPYRIARFVARARGLTSGDSLAWGANVIKISKVGDSVSFLGYPNFDREAHPVCEYNVYVDVAQSRVSQRRYGGSANPPILHRKELFVAPNYPLRARFARLTRQEERAGLLQKPPGRLVDWETLVRSTGYQIRGHRLMQRKE
jgi:DNA phosphorothioation-associated putative methyltransferase